MMKSFPLAVFRFTSDHAVATNIPPLLSATKRRYRWLPGGSFNQPIHVLGEAFGSASIP
jgi:hypothetical protein